MAIVETDNPELRKELLALEKLIEQGGGGIHSKVVICDQGGGLSIKTTEPMERGKEIIRLSRDTLLPSDKYNVLVKKDEFRLEIPKNSSLSSLQRQLAETMITLYNLTSKVKLHKELSFSLSLQPYPELIEKIQEGRMFGKNLLNWSDRLQKGMEEDEFNEFVSDSFLKTRYLGYGDYLRTSDVSTLMPLIDFLNHHWQGAAFHVGIGVRKGDLAVTANQVVDGSTECYAFYGPMDALDTLLRYDFIDEYAPVVRSVPIVLEVDGYGAVKVNSTPGIMNQKKLGKQIADLNRFIPTLTLRKDKQFLGVSHLLIPTDGSPKALRRVLYIILANMTGEPEMDKDFYEPWIRRAEAKILEVNNTFYRGLLELTEKIAREKGTGPGLDRVNQMARVQLRKLEQYLPMDVYAEKLNEQKAAQAKKTAGAAVH
ncbi:MAG TPA: hypothetical protein DEA55_04800 [Rhodospirillaceae bacterium]|nr:hypothetical protein [Rhodospirillaceae bacterium]